MEKKICICSNLTGDGFIVDGLDEISDLVLYNKKGKAVLYQRCSDGDYVSLGDFSDGVYEINIVTSKGVFKREIIKKSL